MNIEWTSFVMGFVSCFILCVIVYVMPAFLDVDDV